MTSIRELALESSDRLLILAPHPDDETITAGGLIQKAVEAGLPVRLVYLTYGDNAETSFIAYRRRLAVGARAQQMGMLRAGEALAATGALGLPPDKVTFLGYPDFRTLVMWAQHWGDVEPCQSMFTQTSVVPYANALRPGTPYRADEVLADLEGIIREFRPTKIVVSHPADHNPDHLSLYLFTRVALWNLSHELRPQLLPSLTHHPEWPAPTGLNPTLPLVPPERLERDATWLTSPLSPQEVERKLDALRQHRTQLKMSAAYLESFIRANELFGSLPEPALASSNQEAALYGTPGAPGAIPPQLTNSERARWVGVERRSLWKEDGCLVLLVQFSRPLGDSVGSSVYLFGYREDRPFAHMPKLQIRLAQVSHSVFDQARRLPSSAVEVRRADMGYLLRVPFDVLGNPRRLMGSVRTYAGKIPLDWIAWRIVSVETNA